MNSRSKRGIWMRTLFRYKASKSYAPFQGRTSADISGGVKKSGKGVFGEMPSRMMVTPIFLETTKISSTNTFDKTNSVILEMKGTIRNKVIPV
ncbi:hypothetical protein Tco_0159167 [Tanacetum coccineum]